MTRAVPPGRRTRWNSAAALLVSGIWWITPCDHTRSKHESANGKRGIARCKLTFEAFQLEAAAGELEGAVRLIEAGVAGAGARKPSAIGRDAATDVEHVFTGPVGKESDLRDVWLQRVPVGLHLPIEALRAWFCIRETEAGLRCTPEGGCVHLQRIVTRGIHRDEPTERAGVCSVRWMGPLVWSLHLTKGIDVQAPADCKPETTSKRSGCGAVRRLSRRLDSDVRLHIRRSLRRVVPRLRASTACERHREAHEL